MKLGGQSFEDKRLTFEEWPEVKQTFPFEQIPVLEVTENSKTYQIAQSHAIERYLAKKLNLAQFSWKNGNSKSSM